MIWVALAQVVVQFIGAITSWLPKVDTLPKIFGYDIDTPLAQGMASFYQFIQYIWPLQPVFYAFLALMGYHAIKLFVRVILGSRAPQ